MAIPSLRYSAAAVVALIGLSGCSKPRVAVSGTVTVNGKPMDHGGVEFVPLDPELTPIKRFGGSVSNGAYAISADRGPLPGKYRVEISWMKATGKKGSAGTDGNYEMRAEALPPKFNEKSELTADITSGKNTLDFDLTP